MESFNNIVKDFIKKDDNQVQKEVASDIQQQQEQIPDDIQMSIMQDKKSLIQAPKLKISQYGKKVLFSIIPDDNKERIKNDVVVVIDISGSMEEEAAVKNQAGEKEKHGLSKLDILKHAVKTTIFSLGQEDRFSLVSFSDNAKIEFPLNYMTKANQTVASNILNHLFADGQTNLWGGLQKGIDVLKDDIKDQGRHRSIILLTDGEPNIFPPSSHQQQLQKQMKKHPELRFSLQTFAFGKKTDSELLKELAEEGHGDYSFIPCPGFIGTIFVNTLSNLLSTICVHSVLEVEGLYGTNMSSHENSKVSQKVKVDLEDIKFGQSRDYAVQIENLPNDSKQPILRAQVKYYDYATEQNQTILSEDYFYDENKKDPMAEVIYWKQEMRKHVFRAFDVQKKQKDLPQAQEIIKAFAKNMRAAFESLEGEDDERLDLAKEYMGRILKDVEGEITLSFLKVEWFDTWGQHYLPSLMNAHVKQICNNFKDHGIQNYGGKVFDEIKEQAEQIFLSLPPPQPSKKEQAEHIQQKLLQQGVINQSDIQDNIVKQGGYVQPIQQPVMQQYYDAGGGCFAKDCLVQIQGNVIKRIQDLKKGDILSNGSKVVALIKITNKQNFMKMVHFKENGLILTPNHPIKINNQWIRPFQVQQPEIFECSEVYNVVLDTIHTILVNGIECVTLGHQIQENGILHPYFGTKKIVQDLSKIRGFLEGNVEVDNSDFIRDQNQRIYGIKI